MQATGRPLPAEDRRFLYSLPGVLAAVAAYSALHVGARLLASGNLGEDDPLDSLLIQTLQAGYGVRNGPLYDWLLWLLQQNIGTGVHAFLLLKYGLLVAMAGFIFLLARRVTGSALWGFMAVDAMALVYQIFWRFHEGFTHRVGAMALAVATLWALVRLIDRGRRRDYALFAVLAGLGLLSEHSYAVLLFAALAAAALQPATRRVVYAPAMLAALPLTLLIVAPYAAWLLEEPTRMQAFVAGMLTVAAEHTPKNPLHALSGPLVYPLMVLSPYIFILPLVFPSILSAIRRQSPLRPHTGSVPDPEQLILHILLVELAWLLLFDGLLLPRTNYAVHSLLPMFIPALVWLTEKGRQSLPSPRRIGIFVAIMLTLTVVAFAGRVANMYVLDPVCKKCRWGIPYAGLAEALRERGFQGGTIIVDEEELGGNLRRFFPDARFILTSKGGIVPPETAESRAGQTALVWQVKRDDTGVPSRLLAHLPPSPGTVVAQRVEVPWRHPWRPDGYRTSTWAVLLSPG